MRLLLAAVVLLFAPPALAASVVPFHDVITGTIDNYARPKFAVFAQSSGKLRDDVAALCKSPSMQALATAREAFKAEVVAFSEVEFLQMGPLGVADRFQRLLFWPDSRGIALRQVQQTLAAKDPTASSPDSLRAKSVALQGLNAIEFLLFGTGADELGSGSDSYRCGFAGAATTLVAGIAATVSDEWASAVPGGASDAMLNPQPNSSDYRTELEVMNKIAGTLNFGNDTMRDQRLSPILSFSTGTPKPHAALFWRSGMTGRALAANFAGLRELFMAAGFDHAVDAANKWVPAGILFEFNNAIAAADNVPESIDAAVATPAIMLGLRQMYVSTGSLDTLDDSLGQALGLSTGFSALDGD